jgi:hypothetical protein
MRPLRSIKQGLSVPHSIEHSPGPPEIDAWQRHTGRDRDALDHVLQSRSQTEHLQHLTKLSQE